MNLIDKKSGMNWIDKKVFSLRQIRAIKNKLLLNPSFRLEKSLEYWQVRFNQADSNIYFRNLKKKNERISNNYKH